MAQRSKTKEKILKTALALFNNEGENTISSVDIAAVMGISPGNLYYHYKGKDSIIVELFHDFETELRLVLNAPIHKPMEVEDNWIYLYIIFEEIFDFRFFFYNMMVILERNPELGPRFARLLSEMSTSFERLFEALQDKALLSFKPGERARLSERLCAHFIYWFPYMRLRNYTGKIRDLIHEGVYEALLQITPFWREDSEPFAVLLKDFFDEQKS